MHYRRAEDIFWGVRQNTPPRAHGWRAQLPHFFSLKTRVVFTSFATKNVDFFEGRDHLLPKITFRLTVYFFLPPSARPWQAFVHLADANVSCIIWFIDMCIVDAQCAHPCPICIHNPIVWDPGTNGSSIHLASSRGGGIYQKFMLPYFGGLGK